ncbi:MAG TPA: DUF2264 domain-containing protein, partial [Candidatus Deferrimicrobium sp.]|nr:DUF2264 domain-containing protein [Candidatus Deferrimicrobium sp.]
MPDAVLDRGRSPHTGWTRDHWVNLLGTLTGAFASAASDGGSPARPRLPGSDGGVVNGLEGFARMSVAWGAWLGLASNGTFVPGREGPIDLLRLVVRGLHDGTDPSGRWRWGEMGDRDQRIVEAADLSTGLWLGRRPLARGLGPEGLHQVLTWLSQVHGLDVFDDNWVLFPVIVAAVARGFGRRVPDSAIDAGLDIMLDRYRGDGWYTDGPGEAFDAYTGWAVHWDMLLWARIDGDRRPRIRTLVEQRARAYLAGIVPQFAADGSRPLFGRSLGYRFAAAAPYALAELLGLGAVPPGLARRVASGTIVRHLEQGALDPATGWFRRGVAGERPEVCERYMSAGASAWAAHVLVALGLPPDAPFWVDREEPLPAEQSDGRRALRGPGFLLGWRRATGETWLVNAKSGHPPDIPGHDYRPYYGKLIYRSHFPFTVRDAAGNPTADGGIVFESPGAVGHRSTTERGGVGDGWAWSVYRVDAADRHHHATTIVLPWRTLEIRATGLRPDGPTRAIESPATLATDGPTSVVRRSSGQWMWESSATATHAVAIRALGGYDRLVAGRPQEQSPDLDLVADHVERPSVEESRPSSRPRVLASATSAVAARTPATADLESVVVDVLDRWVLEVRLADEETCTLVLARSGPPVIIAGSRRVTGPSIRVVRARQDDAGFAGEAIGEIEGVVRLDRPGP